jgi:hypothetical protein
MYHNGTSQVNIAQLVQWPASGWVLRVWQMAKAEFLIVITTQLTLETIHPPAQRLLVHIASIWL